GGRKRGRSMKKNESQKPISLEELLRGLREQNEYQAKIISMQEETISLQNKQNEELAEMLDKVLRMTESGE
uniref:hypothetical protein n=2 Tax=Enterocloster clostridioformis TaxID=1531 RepID=UPI0025A5281C